MAGRPAGTLAEDHDEGERRNTGIDVTVVPPAKSMAAGSSLPVPADIDPVEQTMRLQIGTKIAQAENSRSTTRDRGVIAANVIEGDRDECIRALHVLEAEGVGLPMNASRPSPSPLPCEMRRAPDQRHDAEAVVLFSMLSTFFERTMPP